MATKKVNPLRTESAVRTAKKRFLSEANVSAEVRIANNNDIVVYFEYIPEGNEEGEVIAEISVNDFLRKAPIMEGARTAKRILSRKKK